jgi:hypothetical protein
MASMSQIATAIARGPIGVPEQTCHRAPDPHTPIYKAAKAEESKKRQRDTITAIPFPSFVKRSKVQGVAEKLLRTMTRRQDFPSQAQRVMDNLSSNTFLLSLLSEDEAFIIRGIPMADLKAMRVKSLMTASINGVEIAELNQDGFDFPDDHQKMAIDIDKIIIQHMEEEEDSDVEDPDDADKILLAVFRGAHDDSEVIYDQDWLEDTISYKKVTSVHPLPLTDIVDFEYGELYVKFKSAQFFGIPFVDSHISPAELKDVLADDESFKAQEYENMLKQLEEIRPELSTLASQALSSEIALV